MSKNKTLVKQNAVLIGTSVMLDECIEIAIKHPRVKILKPGCGVGGHCIAIVPWFIASQCPQNSKLIQTARNVNNFKTK